MQALVLTHAPHEDLGHFGEALKEAGAVVRKHAQPAGGGDIRLGEAELVISLGGPMGAHDDSEHPWLVSEAGLLATAARAGRKVLGICLGAQLLARGLGGGSRRGTGPEIGFGTVELTDEGRNDPVLAAMRSPERVLHWHRDVIEAPPEATILARTGSTPVQAFRLGRHAYGLQFHLEVGRNSMQDWLASDAVRRDLQETPGAPPPEDLLAGAAEHEKRMTFLCTSIVNRLINLI